MTNSSVLLLVILLGMGNCFCPASAGESALPPRPAKEAWEKSLGTRDAIREQLKARLLGWPETALVNSASLPAEPQAFLQRVAADTWRGLLALSDRDNGLPLDFVRFGDATVDSSAATIGDYTTPTNIGLRFIALGAAMDLGLIDRSQAARMAATLLSTLERLERYKGFYFNYYDTTTLERNSHFLSFVDSAWLTAGLMAARQAFPELDKRCSQLIRQSDYGFFYDGVLQHMNHGYYVDQQRYAEHHYGLLYTEARLGSLIAMGKGDVPPAHWFAMHRTMAETDTWQNMTPVGRHPKHINGYVTQGGRYRWRNAEYVPSWGGSLFEALMPRLVLDEAAVAPDSLGHNGALHATIHRLYALEDLHYPVWGLSPSSTPGSTDYHEYGVKALGVAGYPAGVVTPHASALALPVLPNEAIANLRELVQRYPIYGEYGFYDAVSPQTGQVSYQYLALDQSMIFIALANYLAGGSVHKRFAADPIIQRVLPVLGRENFFD